MTRTRKPVTRPTVPDNQRQTPKPTGWVGGFRNINHGTVTYLGNTYTSPELAQFDDHKGWVAPDPQNPETVHVIVNGKYHLTAVRNDGRSTLNTERLTALRSQLVDNAHERADLERLIRNLKPRTNKDNQ